MQRTQTPFAAAATFLLAIALVLAGAAGPLHAQRGPQQDGRRPLPRTTHTITIRPSAQVSGSEILLSDVAEVKPRDLLGERLANLVLAPAPKTRLYRELTRTGIQQALGAGGFDLQTLKLQGPDRLTVQPVFRRIPGDEIRKAAETVLDAVLEAEGAVDPRVDRELTTNLVAVDVPPGRRSMEIFARVKKGQTMSGHAVVEVLFEVDGKPWRTIPLNYRLTRYQYVLRPTGPILQGTPLGEHNLERVVEPAQGAIGLFAQEYRDVAGMVAKRNLPANRRLSMTADVAPPAVIRTGQRVTLVVINGRVRIAATAIARGDAALGEPVELVNPNSGKVVAAVAQGPGLAVADVSTPIR